MPTRTMRRTQTLFPLLEPRNVPKGVPSLRGLVGVEVGRRLAGTGAPHVHVEPLALRIVGGIPQVPLPEVAGPVANPLQRLGQGGFLEGKLVHVLGWQKLPSLAPPDPVGDVQAGRVPTGEEAGPGGGADGAGRVGLGEPHPRRGQSVDMGRQVEGTPIGAQVPPSQVVDEEEDEVRRSLGDRGVTPLSRATSQAQGGKGDPHRTRSEESEEFPAFEGCHAGPPGAGSLPKR